MEYTQEKTGGIKMNAQYKDTLFFMVFGGTIRPFYFREC